ncbi:MAG: cyclopropane fatty acyl phospholipid synthase [Candidatus Nanoarchaeia archaeon]
MIMKQTIQECLSLANVQINGNRPWDIQVHNPKFYARSLAGGSLALGESYMDGWWDCEQLDQFINKVLKAKLDEKVGSKSLIWNVLKAKVINMQSRSRAYEVGKHHYDIGNDLYKHMLDKRMVYSCGYWRNAKTLDRAQEEKLDLICNKMGLKPGMKVLDIGCGWGSFMRYAAEKYGVECVGITISKEQVKLARAVCRGLPVKIRLQDYRKLKGRFDRIISIGMFEHVGYKNYRTYMEVVDRCLKQDGLFLLHTIGGNQSVCSTDPWINRYIFPNSMLPSMKQINAASEGLFVLEDVHSFGAHYDKTLMAWYDNFTENWNKIKSDYDQRFYRMWTYYLLSCAGTFRSRKNQLWQIVFSKKGVNGGYQGIR